MGSNPIPGALSDVVRGTITPHLFVSFPFGGTSVGDGVRMKHVAEHANLQT
ncbi:MAG: hypothetical protein O8C64_15020 [Candidatus Methanoperedens sp.]|nr:hypothetical protein [Candidatus Methanoperedens sp.]MCZ7404186.1 hypothetical protein [Candidatus Methanoperedens sp.]